MPRTHQRTDRDPRDCWGRRRDLIVDIAILETRKELIEIRQKYLLLSKTHKAEDARKLRGMDKELTGLKEEAATLDRFIGRSPVRLCVAA